MKQLSGSTLALTALLTLLPACEQPKANCTAGLGGFAAKYTLKEGSKMGTGSCDTLKGETIGLAKYNPLKEGEKLQQDLTKAFLAIRTPTLGGFAADQAEEGMPLDADQVTSRGDFVSTRPDDNDVCSVPKLSPAQADVTETDADMNMITRHIEYVWSNVRLYVTAAYPGTQMVGDLSYTEDECTASYSVLGLWPNVDCTQKDMNGQTTKDDAGNFLVNPDLCDPVADPASGRATGSGINPDLKPRTTCDKTIGLCVLTEPPPALK